MLNRPQGTLDLNKFISSISLALDLAESCIFKEHNFDSKSVKAFSELDIKNHDFTSHSKKTALIALHLSKKLGYSGDKLNSLYIAAFLHDIGAVDALRSCHTDSTFIFEHCEFGSKIIKKLPLDHDISSFIKYHHECFDGLGPFGLCSNETPQEAQIIHIADFFEIIYNRQLGSMQRELIMNWFKSQKYKMFDPYLVDLLIEVAESERFWLDLENMDRDYGVLERMRPKIYTPMNLNQLSDISTVFADIIDKKSAFTGEHSIRLSHNTSLVASAFGYEPLKIEKIKIASLLHDIGKLAIPNSILDKPGKLTKEEYSIIKSHAYYTRLVLDKIDNIQDICDWASNHHETLNGKGYPEGLEDRSISLESRIISVCDIYQGITEDRPYRAGMSKVQAFKLIDEMVSIGNLDSEVVKKLKEIV